MIPQAPWQTDWLTFVVEVASAYSKGGGDLRVSQQFAGKWAEWSGTVVGLNFEGNQAAVHFSMPIVKVDLGAGKTSTVDSLIGRVEEDDVDSWRDVEIGSSARFRVRLAAGELPTALATALIGESHCALVINTVSCVLLETSAAKIGGET